MIRDCAGFEAWLDGDRDATLEASARAHALGCARCAAALELESLLAVPPAARAGAAFTEGVMLRVRDAERAQAARRLTAVEAPTEWWLRAPAEPSMVLAFAVAALIAWRGDGLWSAALGLAGWLRALDWGRLTGAALPDAIGRTLAGNVTGTLASGALVAVLLPLVAGASYLLYRGIEKVVADAFAGSGGAAAPRRA